MEPTTGPVDIRLLGGFRVAVDGREISDEGWASRRARELVQLLALAPDRSLVRDQVIEALWPHLDAHAGGANLRKAAHHARQALGTADAIVLKAGSVRLFPDRQVATDVEQFTNEANDALAAHDAAACAALAARYAGELLPGALYEEWTEPHRARLRSLWTTSLRTAGAWADLVELDPTDEAAYRELMREALAEGRRAAAIRWYGRLREALAVELGVSPDDESERLYAACLEGLEPAASVFVGRDMELAEIAAFLKDAGTTRANVVVLCGPAGIGKSALGREVVRSARRNGWVGAGLDAGDFVEPYGPVRAAIDRLVAADRSVLDRVGASTRSVLGSFTDVATPDAPSSEGPLSRHQVVGAFRRLLFAASAGDPVLLMLDDAHMADDATIDVLIQLATSGGPIAIVLATRPRSGNPTLDRAVARLRRADRLLTVELGPLDVDDSTKLVQLAVGDELPSDVVSRIVEQAEGNPFLALELARGAAGGGAQAVPRDVNGAIASRLIEVDDDTMELLRRVALASGEFDSTTVAALTGASEEVAFRVLDIGLDAGVLVVSDGRYRFRHDLVRQALVDQVPPHEQVAVHRDAARRLAKLGAPPAVVAHHWLAGGRPHEATPYLLTAAQRAMALGAFADAVGLVDQLLAHEPRHAAARLLRAEALDFMGDVRTVGAYDDAIEVCRDDEVHDLRAKRALAQLKQGDPTGALQSLEGVRPTSVEGRLAEALTFSGAAALGLTDPAMGTKKSAECRRAALESGDAAAIVVASWSQAAAAHARGELRQSVLADLRDTTDLPHLAVRVFDGQLCVTQRLLYGARPYADVIAFADSLAAEAARLGASRGEAFGVTLRGEAELLSGGLDEAERDLLRGAKLHRAIGGATGEAHALQRLAELALHRGCEMDARALLDEALDLARSTDIGFHLLDRIYGTRIAVAREPAEALAVVEEAEDVVRGTLETCPGCRITFAVPAAIAAARAGDLDRAHDYEEASEFLAEVVMRLPAWNAALDELRGHIKAAEGDRPAAISHLAAAASGFRTAEQPLDALRCEALAAAL